MARIVKEHTVRRNEILDVSRRLMYTKGYEQMTIQDILDDLQISKGAFYHYFDSKQALLEAVIERMQEEVKQLLLPIVHESDVPALAKLARFFPMLARWKTARKSFILSLLRILYADDNAIFRQKARATAVKQVTPLLTEVIRQGIQEGVLSTPYPDHIGEVVISLVLDLGDAFASLLLSSESNPGALQSMESTVAAYSDALERVLGAPKGSLPLVDAETLKEWMILPGETQRDVP